MVANFEKGVREIEGFGNTLLAMSRIVKYFNMDTDVRRCMDVLKDRRKMTKEERKLLIERSHRARKRSVESEAKPRVRAWSFLPGSTENLQAIESDKRESDPKLYMSDTLPITVKNMSFNRGDICLFRNVTLSTAQGKLVAIAGGHGCGKTSLLHLLGHKTFP